LEQTLKFLATDIEGTYLVEIEPHTDARGSFARVFCKREFEHNGLDIDVVQASISSSSARGTIRGLHFQWPPSCEAKLVRCQRGRVHDVIVDLRPDSPTFTRHAVFELSCNSHSAVFVPQGCAHGFQSLENDSELVYMMSDYYQPQLQDGIRYNDPFFAISWPLPVSVISDRDLEYRDFNPETHASKFHLSPD